MKEGSVIFNGVFGSHLYGVSTPSSDKDFKGVYKPPWDEVVMHTYKDSIDTQTEEEDTTFYSLMKFVKILGKCDTVSYDMIHTPREFTLQSTPLWGEIRKHRSDLYCKNMRGILGYIKTQSLKYGHKQERYNEMVDFLNMVEKVDVKARISDTPLPELAKRGYKYITYTPDKGDIKANIDVCGSRYQATSHVEYLLSGLRAKIEKYGDRTKKGNTAGGDWKSLSHSYRVLLQLGEIIETRDLVFPLVKRNDILKMKLGGFTQDECMSIITDLYDVTVDSLNNSDLPDYSDTTNLVNLLLNEYK